MSNTNPELLRISSKHLSYEVQMLQGCFESLQESQDNTFLHHALLESFLIHTRVIYDFLFKPTHGDDIGAKHFLDRHTRWKPTPDKFLKQTVKSINKSLTHLTYARLTSQAQWNILKIHNSLITYLQDFSRSADETNLHPSFGGLTLDTAPETSRLIVTNTSVPFSSYRH